MSPSIPGWPLSPTLQSRAMSCNGMKMLQSLSAMGERGETTCLPADIGSTEYNHSPLRQGSGGFLLAYKWLKLFSVKRVHSHDCSSVRT